MYDGVTEMDQENIQKRIKQFEEMETIWERNDESVKAYLEGCIHTAVALSLRTKKVG